MRIAYALAAALAMGSAHAQPHPPTITKPVCSPVPKNWRLGDKPVPFEEVDKKLSGSPGWKAYKSGRRSQDQYREFRDGRTQGILVTRLGCLHSYFITQ